MAKVTYNLNFEFDSKTPFELVVEMLDSASFCDLCQHSHLDNDEAPCNECLILIDGNEIEEEAA